MRGLVAVIGMLFHANLPIYLAGTNLPIFSSGFYFIDFFAILSSYLLTSVLLGEYATRGRIDFKDFYLRRARRLLPAMYLVVVLVVIATGILYPEAVYDLRGPVVAVTGYVYNWYSIWTSSSYFDSFDLLPINHLWSLSVEEQFYFVWPLLMIVLFTLLKRRVRLIPWVMLCGALLTVLAGFYVYNGGLTIVPSPDQNLSIIGHEVNRKLFLYMSSITRAGGFFVGAALAFWWRPERFPESTPRLDRRLDIAGIVSLGVLFLVTNFQLLTDDVHGLAVTVLTPAVWLMCVVLLMAATRSQTKMFNVLIVNRPLRRFGELAYFLYLVHWPIFQFIRRYPFKPVPLLGFAISLPLAIVAAMISMRYFEKPIRKMGFLPWLRSLSPVARRSTLMSFSALTLVAGMMLVTAKPTVSELEQGLQGAPKTGTQVMSDVEVLGVSDSVMLMAYDELEARGVLIEGASNRSFAEGSGIAKYIVGRGLVKDSLIMHLGSNSEVTESGLRDVLDAATSLRRVVLVTIHRPDWKPEQSNNAVIRTVAQEYSNVVVADWHTFAKANPKILMPDGIHLSYGGLKPYADLLTAALDAPAGTTIDALRPVGAP